MTSSGAAGGASRPGSSTLARQSGLTSIAAAAAIASGLLLDVAIAATFGAGSVTDAFFVAARLPLGLVQIVLVGANQALVPAISNWLVTKGERDTWRLVSHLLTATPGAGLVLAGLAWVAAGPLMRLTAPGIGAGDARLAASLARVVFLVVPLVAAAEVLRALLNARYAFVAPAAMNVVMNGVAAAIVIGPATGIRGVAWAYLIGAAAQLLFMLVAARARGFHYRPGLGMGDPDLARVARLCVRPLAGAGLNPVARVAEQAVVSFLPAGSITVLNYATRLIAAIGGTVFFRSIIVAIVPRLAEATARDDEREVQRLTRAGVRLMLAVSLPLTAFVAVLARPAIAVVFRRGSFTRADTAQLGLVLAVYSASLVGLGVQRALLAPFFARLDTRVPLRNTVYGIAANLAPLPLVVLPLSDRPTAAMVALALAFSLAQYVNVVHAAHRLRRDHGLRFPGMVRYATRLALAASVSGAAMATGAALLGLYGPQSRLTLVGGTLLVAGIGVTVFVGATHVLRPAVAPIRGR